MSTTNVYGGSGSISLDWTFPVGTDVGDKIFVAVPDGFTLREDVAYPNGRPLYDANGTLLATASRSSDGKNLVITREVSSASWGEIDSATTLVMIWDYQGDLQPGGTATSQWISTTSYDASSTPWTFTITNEAPIVPAWYGPRKSGVFSYDSSGQPIITWYYFSETGPAEVGKIKISDSVGAGQELDCSSMTGSVGFWDQSTPAGIYTYEGSYSWVGGSYSCDATGFAGTLGATGLTNAYPGYSLPADQPGVNASVASKVAYLQLVYRTKVTDFSLAQTGWTNVVNWYDAAADTTKSRTGTVRFPGNASGNRAVTVRKIATGDPTQYEGLRFTLTVDCTGGAPGYPQDVTLQAGEATTVYAPIGATCSVSESDPQGADRASASDPVVITAALTDTFVLTVTNAFSPHGVVSWSKVDKASGDALGGSSWSLNGPEGLHVSIVDNGDSDSDKADGKFAVNGLAAGTYSLVETTAPDGYDLDATPHTFVISADSPTRNLGAIVNEKTAQPSPSPTTQTPTVTPSPSPTTQAPDSRNDLPNTGGRVVGVGIVGVLLLMGGIAVLMLKRREA